MYLSQSEIVSTRPIMGGVPVVGSMVATRSSYDKRCGGAMGRRDCPPLDPSTASQESQALSEAAQGYVNVRPGPDSLHRIARNGRHIFAPFAQFVAVSSVFD